MNTIPRLAPRTRLLLAAAACAVSITSAQAATVTAVHSFDANPNSALHSGLVLAGDGNFYGTTDYEGANQSGTVFRLTPGGAYTVLHTFSAMDSRFRNDDGAIPHGLALGKDGNFYGTTDFGGSHGVGVAFRVTPAGGFTVLATNFVSVDVAGRLTAGGDGNLYGVNYSNILFRLTPTGDVSSVYKFGASTQPGGHFNVNPDGVHVNPLLLAADGNFYGTAQEGGPNGTGTVFKVTPGGALTVLHTFNALSYTDDGTPDGAFGANAGGGLPFAGLAQGGDGSFYGTTQYGGANGTGTLFKVTPAGAFTTLHEFGAASGSAANADGARPVAALASGSDGSLYGSARAGGANGTGTLFKVTPAGTFTLLHSFSAVNAAGVNPDGRLPDAALVQAADGSFLGTTALGGANGKGTIFRLTAAGGGSPAVSPFFTGETALGNGVNYLSLPNNNYFGYYSYLADPHYLYHFDLGYEYVFDANDGKNGVFLYDFKSGGFFYTSPSFPFPYLYDFALKAVLYYFPDPNNPGRYNTDGVRYFSNLSTGQIISK